MASATWTAHFKAAAGRNSELIGIAGLMNLEDTDYRRTIDIREIRVTPCAPISSTGLGTVSLRRISAMSGGTALTPAKSNLGAGNLPSQVSCVVYPDSVTVSSKLRELMAASHGLQAPPTIGSPVQIFGPRVPNMESRVEPGLSTVFKAATGSVIQAIRLAEGEGLALTLDTPAQGQLTPFEIWVKDGSGNQYLFSDYDRAALPMCPDQAVYGIFNGSGSGVTLDVLVVRWPTVHMNTDQFDASGTSLPDVNVSLVIYPIQGYRFGSLVTPVAHKSDADALTNIYAIQGPFLPAMNGRNVPLRPGYLTGVIMHHRTLNKTRIESDQVADPVPIRDGGVLFRARSNAAGMILKSGEGIMISNNKDAGAANIAAAVGGCVQAVYNVDIVFNHNSPPPAGSGISRSRIFARS